MKLDISLKDLAKLQAEILSKQPAVTLAEAKAQVAQLKQQSSSTKKNNNDFWLKPTAYTNQ